MAKKILICDDAPEILEVLEIILTGVNYNVKTIEDSEGIIDVIKEFNPDLILLDLWIKNFDGREVAKLIKSDNEISKIPVMFISALNELDKIAQDSNVDGFIKKPFEMDDLITKVQEVLEKKENV